MCWLAEPLWQPGPPASPPLPALPRASAHSAAGAEREKREQALIATGKYDRKSLRYVDDAAWQQRQSHHLRLGQPSRSSAVLHPRRRALLSPPAAARPLAPSPHTCSAALPASAELRVAGRLPPPPRGPAALVGLACAEDDRQRPALQARRRVAVAQRAVPPFLDGGACCRAVSPSCLRCGAQARRPLAARRALQAPGADHREAKLACARGGLAWQLAGQLGPALPIRAAGLCRQPAAVNRRGAGLVLAAAAACSPRTFCSMQRHILARASPSPSLSALPPVPLPPHSAFHKSLLTAASPALSFLQGTPGNRAVDRHRGQGPFPGTSNPPCTTQTRRNIAHPEHPPISHPRPQVKDDDDHPVEIDVDEVAEADDDDARAEMLKVGDEGGGGSLTVVFRARGVSAGCCRCFVATLTL